MRNSFRRENATPYLTKYLFHIKYKMNTYESDLKKYWYVKTSTLNKINSDCFSDFLKRTHQAQDSMRNQKAKEEKQKINATKKRNWKYVKKIFERYYWNIDCCMICWNKENLQIHHKDKNRRNNDSTNLVKICVDCHIKAHEWEKAWIFLSNIYHKSK